MKGIVFNMLTDLVEERFGLDAWDGLIEETQPASEGAYTAVAVYPDEELLGYVNALARRTSASAADICRLFGEFMLHKFAEIHPEFFDGHTAKSFLQSVHDVIHVEVRKLHPDVVLPEFTYGDPGPDELILNYHSPRELCHLAEGLITGAGQHFGVNISWSHDVCMHDGADHCRLGLHFEAAPAAAVG